MLARRLNLAQRLLQHGKLMQIPARNNTSEITEDARDPAPYFFDEKVQNLLKILIRPIPYKVFRRRLDSSKIEEPEYKFMTNEQLKEAQNEAEIKMWELLQIPPFVKIRNEEVKILSNDPALTGLNDCKYVFTDITYGVSNKNRVIVVREPNGILRTATSSERDRLNQIYFPIPGREIETPKMFEEKYMKAIFNREDYEFVLNRACVQFDPDNPEFHRILKETFEEIDKKMKFNKLRSTRHYGLMVFYLAWNKNIDNLLYENLSKTQVEDAALLIQLYYILNPISVKLQTSSHYELIDYYIQNNVSDNVTLNQAFINCCERLEEKKKLQNSIEQLHKRDTEDHTINT